MVEVVNILRFLIEGERGRIKLKLYIYLSFLHRDSSWDTVIRKSVRLDPHEHLAVL